MKLASIVARPKHYVTLCRRYQSTQVGVKQQLEDNTGAQDIQIKSKDELGSEKSFEAPKKRVSPSRRFFLGQFDTDILTYPEVLNKERFELLSDLVKPIEQFFQNKVDTKQIDQNAKIPADVLDGLKQLGLFGIQIPQEYGGLGLNATEFARVGEFISDGSIYVTLAAHQSIGLKGLLLYGTEAQKEKYLPRLASGEVVAAFCLTEPTSGSDAASIQTKAELSEDGKTWYLTGSKIWISNGGIADFFTVFAKTADDNVHEKNPRRITAFAVERSFGGITNGKPEDKHGIRGSNTCEVHFDRTPVPVENIIGEVGGGFKVAVNILNSGRFSMGSACASALRRAQEIVAEHVITRKQFGKPLKDFGLVREKLSRLAIDAYVMESMSYLTAGMLDFDVYQDCAVEAAIVKVMSSEMLNRGLTEVMQVFGGMGYMKDHPVDVALRDGRILTIFEGTNEILRLFIALMGVQTAGKELRELVKKIRNPFKFPSMVFERSFMRARHQKDNPKFTLGLKRFLHPTLSAAADQLEYSTLRLQYAVELVLERHGAKVVDQQYELKRLADIVCDIYAMAATLSRASRAYCIGLQNAHIEVSIALVFCNEATDRVKHNILQIECGDKDSGDQMRDTIAEAVCMSRGYPCQHPLTRTFW